MAMIESWSPVKGFEGLYETSNMGNVRSLGFYFNGGQYGQTIYKPGKTLAKVKMPNGYLKAHLWKSGKGLLKSIHRIVAESFIENPCNKPYVNHINGNKEDNRVENLEWCTAKENAAHAWKNNLITVRIGVGNPGANKAVVQLDLSGNEICEFVSIKDAASATGIHGSNIVMCLKGRVRRTKQYRWRYKTQVKEIQRGY